MRKNKQGDFYFHIPFAAPLTLGGSTFEHEMMRQSFAVIVCRIVCHVTHIGQFSQMPVAGALKIFFSPHGIGSAMKQKNKGTVRTCYEEVHSLTRTSWKSEQHKVERRELHIRLKLSFCGLIANEVEDKF